MVIIFHIGLDAALVELALASVVCRHDYNSVFYPNPLPQVNMWRKRDVIWYRFDFVPPLQCCKPCPVWIDLDLKVVARVHSFHFSAWSSAGTEGRPAPLVVHHTLIWFAVIGLEVTVTAPHVKAQVCIYVEGMFKPESQRSGGRKQWDSNYSSFLGRCSHT